MSKEPVKVIPVALGAGFCECGGMFEIDSPGSFLMSDPPKVKLRCPFCGDTKEVVAPYNVKISFRLEDLQGQV